MQGSFEKIIEKLEELQNYNCFPTELVNEKQSKIHSYYANKLTEILKLTEQYNNGWIPCSERLPEKEGKYLVTLDKWNIVSFADFKNLKYNPHFNAPVIAWQPLPQPFQKGELEA